MDNPDWMVESGWTARSELTPILVKVNPVPTYLSNSRGMCRCELSLSLSYVSPHGSDLIHAGGTGGMVVKLCL